MVHAFYFQFHTPNFTEPLTAKVDIFRIHSSFNLLITLHKTARINPHHRALYSLKNSDFYIPSPRRRIYILNLLSPPPFTNSYKNVGGATTRGRERERGGDREKKKAKELLLLRFVEETHEL